MNAATTTETIVQTTKMAMVVDHLKNNKIEYLILLLFSHVLGLPPRLWNMLQECADYGLLEKRKNI